MQNMYKFTIYIVVILLLCSCTEDKNKEKIIPSTPQELTEQKTTETKIKKTEVYSPRVFCACLESKNPLECMELERERCSHIEADSLNTLMIHSPCYCSMVLQKEADKLCECLNGIKQASLDCDDLQKELDQKYTAEVQEIISELFSKMNCMD